jgi:hypothetical protein
MFTPFNAHACYFNFNAQRGGSCPISSAGAGAVLCSTVLFSSAVMSLSRGHAQI